MWPASGPLGCSGHKHLTPTQSPARPPKKAEVGMSGVPSEISGKARRNHHHAPKHRQPKERLYPAAVGETGNSPCH